jgi:4-amino-4-deoxy-L-arabinose transferase-like glycosyltransferase
VLPRALTLLVGLATVVATIWLGRELALRIGRPDWANLVGLGAALLLATSSFHAVVSSRIAWSHALTPLAMTLALVYLLRWERTRGRRDLAGAGLLYGVAVHTHPTMLAVAPGLGIWALLQGRAVVGSRAGWAGVALFLLANLPLFAFNLLSGLGSVAAAAQVQSAYAGGAPTSVGGYLSNLGALLTSVPLLLCGDIGERRGAMLALDDPLPFVYAGLFLVGSMVTLRQRLLLPVLLMVSAGLVLPLFNGKYEPLFNGRYLAPLLPLAFALTVIGVLGLVELVPATRPRATLVAWLVVGLGVIAPLFSWNGYLNAALRDGPNNRELNRAIEIVAAMSPRRPVLVDASLSGTRQSTGREGTGVLEYLLILDGHVAVRRYQPNDLAVAVERGESDLVVVSPRLLTRLDKDFVTEAPPGEEEARARRRASFVVVRIVGPA